MIKIIQILFTESHSTWQGRLLGLGDDGVVYTLDQKGNWEPFIRPLGDLDE